MKTVQKPHANMACSLFEFPGDVKRKSDHGRLRYRLNKRPRERAAVEEPKRR